MTNAAVAALGDVADVLGPNIKPLFGDLAFIDAFLQECLQSDDEQLRTTAAWTLERIRRIMES